MPQMNNQFYQSQKFLISKARQCSGHNLLVLSRKLWRSSDVKSYPTHCIHPGHGSFQTSFFPFMVCLSSTLLFTMKSKIGLIIGLCQKTRTFLNAVSLYYVKVKDAANDGMLWIKYIVPISKNKISKLQKNPLKYIYTSNP